jgi:hypothetical protein
LRSIAKVQSAADASIEFVPYLSDGAHPSDQRLTPSELRLAAKA